MPTLAGTKLDKYEMLEEVGHGGMAVVYRGTDTVLKREVAVKVLHAHLSDREESRLRLEREAIAVAKLRHENILEIFDYSGTKNHESYIVTEFIHGPTLREWIDESLDPRPATAALVIHRLSLALCHAHQGGVIHRDIKPENVMIRKDDGCLKLMDFGIAQILDNQKLTLTGQLIGSPAYMAPELVSGKPLDARTDLFSLGIMLYQLATGQLPFAGRNPHEVLNRIADGDYPAPSTVCPIVDRELEAIIATALATSPDDRYQTVTALATELEAYLEEMGIEPTKAELAAYFRNPEDYVVELDERVARALLRQAEEAASQGHGARAIRLLGRVLEIDGSNKAARGLLARLRTRERRMRQALLGAGMLGVAGIVAAGIMLVPPEARIAMKRAAFSEAHIPAMPGPTSTDPAPTGEDPVVPIDNTAPPTGDTAGSGDPAGETQDDDDDDPPAVGKTREGSGRARPPRTRTPVMVTCKVKLEGISDGSARNLKFRIDGKLRPSKGLVNELEIPGNEQRTFVQIDANAYEGDVTLGFEKCNAGTVTMAVRLKAARLNFKGAQANTSVRCVKGCTETAAFPPEQFPPVELSEPHGHRVVLEFKTEGLASQTKAVVLRPGPNTIAVPIVPLQGG